MNRKGMKNNEIYKEIAQIAPILSEIEKHEEFEVDEQYFQNFESRLERKIFNKTSQPKRKNFAILVTNKSLFMAAASLLILFIFSFLYYQISYKPSKTISTQLYWDEVINNPILVEKIDEKTLIDFFINNIAEPEDFILQHSNKDIEEEEIVKYLQEYVTINNEL